MFSLPIVVSAFFLWQLFLRWYFWLNIPFVDVNAILYRFLMRNIKDWQVFQFIKFIKITVLLWKYFDRQFNFSLKSILTFVTFDSKQITYCSVLTEKCKLVKWTNERECWAVNKQIQLRLLNKEIIFDLLCSFFSIIYSLDFYLSCFNVAVLVI